MPKRRATSSHYEFDSKRVARQLGELLRAQGSHHAAFEMDESAEPDFGGYDPQEEAAGALEEAEPPLSKEQQQVVDYILDGRNVFYTGSAGCGKSTILRAFVKRLQSPEFNKRVRISTPTNLAALNVNGMTLWYGYSSHSCT